MLTANVVAIAVNAATARNASPKSTTRRRVERRDSSCREKKSTPAPACRGRYAPSAGLAERDLGDLALLLFADLEELGRFEAEIVRDEVAREVLARVVVAHYGIVECLACKRDFVLRRCELFLELQHVLIGF
jgi:hypothetical protein